MKIGIIGKSILTEEGKEFCFFLLDYLHNKGVEVHVQASFYELLKREKSNKKIGIRFENSETNLVASFSVMLSLGGDGTLLESLTVIKDTGIPVLGVNMGRLGFLANITKNDIYYAIDELLKGTYRLDQRSVLQFESEESIFGNINFALNDFVIHKNDTSAMVVIHTYINNEFLNSYWGDGLIVSTPTGSTGYSLSCGGPILFPRSNSFAVTPVSPHNLNVRPIIIPDNSVLTFEVEGRSSGFLASLDSRSVNASFNKRMLLRKASFTLNLVHLEGNNYLKTLRTKLNWGLDSRN
jgi:NAD+ kinase